VGVLGAGTLAAVGGFGWWKFGRGDEPTGKNITQEFLNILRSYPNAFYDKPSDTPNVASLKVETSYQCNNCDSDSSTMNLHVDYLARSSKITAPCPDPECQNEDLVRLEGLVEGDPLCLNIETVPIFLEGETPGEDGSPAVRHEKLIDLDLDGRPDVYISNGRYRQIRAVQTQDGQESPTREMNSREQAHYDTMFKENMTRLIADMGPQIQNKLHLPYNPMDRPLQVVVQ